MYAGLNRGTLQLAVQNALRYIPSNHHLHFAKEFADELNTFGHIYMFRFMPNFTLKVSEH
jgi:urocanate hydratase